MTFTYPVDGYVLILSLSPYMADPQCSEPSSTLPCSTRTSAWPAPGLQAPSEGSAPLSASSLAVSVHQPPAPGWNPTWKEEGCGAECLLYLERWRQTRGWDRAISLKSLTPKERRGLAQACFGVLGWGEWTAGSEIRLAGIWLCCLLGMCIWATPCLWTLISSFEKWGKTKGALNGPL